PLPQLRGHRIEGDKRAMSRTSALAIMSNDVAGTNSLADLAVGIHVKHEEALLVRDGPRPPGLHLLFPLPVESTQVTNSADHRGPKKLFLSGTLLSEVPLRTASCAVADSCQVSLLSLPNLQRRHRVASTTTARKQHMPSPRWQRGQSGNPAGRLRGSRSR